MPWNTPIRVVFPVRHELVKTVEGAVPPATLDTTADWRIAANPVRVIPDTLATITPAPVPLSPVTVMVTVIAAGDAGTSWLATKQYKVSALVNRNAVVTLVKVIPFADADIVPAAPPANVDADTPANTTRRSPATGVNDADAYVAAFDVDMVPPAMAFVTAATTHSSQTTPQATFTPAAAVSRIRQKVETAKVNSRPSGAM